MTKGADGRDTIRSQRSLRIAGNSRKLKETRKDSPLSLQKEQSLLTPSFLTSSLRNSERMNWLNY